MKQAIGRYLDRHYPALWWTYPRSNYNMFDHRTFHHKHDPVDRLVRRVRLLAGLFWWSFIWGCVWTGTAALLANVVFELPFWPSFAIFVLGSWEGRCYKDQRAHLLELRGKEADLAMAKEGIPE